MEKDEEIGTGFIERACKNVGVTRGVYYNAKRSLKEGKKLSIDQINVLREYDAITKKAKRDLEAIKSN